MDNKEIIDSYLSRLKTVAVKAREENVSVQAIHARIKRGLYHTIEICGVTFVVED